MDTLLGGGFATSTFNPNNNSSSSSSCSNQSHVVHALKLERFHFSGPPQLLPIHQDQHQQEQPPPPSSEETAGPDSGGGASSEGEIQEENDVSSAVLKYIGDMLMEEDLQNKNCMFQDCMALQAAEKSFYDVLNDNQPLLVDPHDHFTSSGGTTSFDADSSNLVGDFSESQFSDDKVDDFESVFEAYSMSLSSSGSSSDIVDLGGDSPLSPLPVPNEPPWQFKAVHSLESGKTHNTESGHDNGWNNERRNSPDSIKGRKNHQREEGGDLEEAGRSNKLSAIFTDTSEELSDMFDEVLLCGGGGGGGGKAKSMLCGEENALRNGASRKLQQNGQSKASNSRTNRGKKRGNNIEMVDLRGLLTNCAQVVASNDHRTAAELLKKIRQHSSPSGDGSQRLAHYFADGLEARLLGTHAQLQTVLAMTTPASEILKAYQVYITACPHKQMSNLFANKTIMKLTEKATRIHIIDFGILYGFQWPCLIQGLSKRPGGPPKLRITGIELPQSGFRPAERVEETGRRLEKYCKRFNVPFKYSAIAKKWETIQIEDLKIDRDEMVVVNCLYRFRNLPDDTIVSSSPRDSVLNLIKRINPDMFIHGVVNGTYNAPFFLTRFKETLFHFSALFDMIEATVRSEGQGRLMLEKEVFGRDAINIIACEGLERVDRPETYKQWQARHVRAGFRQLPMDEDIFKLVRSKVKTGYHKEFVVDEHGGWMLQGWKGRIMYGLSCWKPAN